MKLYQLLHAKERPAALTVPKRTPFATTENIQSHFDNKDDVIFLVGKHRQDSETEPKKNKKPVKRDTTTPPTDSSTSIDYDQKLTVCNLLRKTPGSYAVSKRVLSELRRRNPLFQPKSHLDFGSGLGPWAWAQQEVFGCQSTVCIDPNPQMRKLARFIKKDDSSIQFYESLSHTVQLPFDQFDLITMAYVLEEIQSPSNRQIVLQSLWQKLAPGGVMVLCCPGSPMGFRFVDDFRTMILKIEGAKILAPCPHHNECPIAKKGVQWCHFQQNVSTWPKNVFPKNLHEKNIISEKFSYMVVQKSREHVEAITIPQIHELSYESRDWSRIVFDPMKRGQHFIIDVCTQSGAMERLHYQRRVVAKSHGTEGGYHDLKRLRQGDLWRYPRWVPNRLKKRGSEGKRLW